MIAAAIMMLNTLEVRYCKGARDHLYILYIMLDDSYADAEYKLFGNS